MNNDGRNRIGWVDAAKGLAILLVIVGHTVESGTFTRNIIFSFHIPLFFLLSGYTFRPSANWADFFYRVKKDAVRLLVPYVLSGLVIALVKIFYRHLAPLPVLRDIAEALIWGSGTGDGIHESIGVLWFLISLFGARQIVNAVCVLYKNDVKDHYVYVIGIIAVLGLGIGMFDWNWLIFNLDVSMAASGFLLAGMEYRRFEESIRRYDRILFPACLLVWMYLMKSVGYIEMSGRWYPELTLGVLEALCGSYCVIRFMEAFCFLSKPASILEWVGRHSLVLMCIHAIEDSLFQFWKTMPVNTAVFGRLACNLVIMVLFVCIKDRFNKRKDTTV